MVFKPNIMMTTIYISSLQYNASMKKQDKNVKRKSLTKARAIAWVFLFVIIIGVCYFIFQPSAQSRNQCDNLPYSFTINEGGRLVEVPVGLANLEVHVNGLVLRPFTRDAFGHVTYLTPQVASGSVLLNRLETVQDLQNVYAYSAVNFPTSQFYRGAIITETGTIQDALYYIERTEVGYTNCLVADK